MFMLQKVFYFEFELVNTENKIIFFNTHDFFIIFVSKAIKVQSVMKMHKIILFVHIYHLKSY